MKLIDAIRLVFAALLATLAAHGPAGAQTKSAPPKPAPTYVDLELVLAVDISLSMQLDEQRLQREGYVAAFRDKAILKAIQSGPQGRIAVSYVEWAGAGIQSVVVPWHLVSTRAEAHDFADTLAVEPIRRARMTSISGALSHSGRMFTDNGYRGLRRVIDVSGDGPNNSGAEVERTRDDLISRGITINGLPIMLQSVGPWGGYFEIPNLDKYYRDCVIGGSGAFALAVRDKSEFATAIRQKLLLEIAGLVPGRRQPSPRVIRTQFAPAPPNSGPNAGKPSTAKYDCLIGEKRWQEFLRDRTE